MAGRDRLPTLDSFHDGPWALGLSGGELLEASTPAATARPLGELRARGGPCFTRVEMGFRVFRVERICGPFRFMKLLRMCYRLNLNGGFQTTSQYKRFNRWQLLNENKTICPLSKCL